jgi:hypothetical protein
MNERMNESTDEVVRCMDCQLAAARLDTEWSHPFCIPPKLYYFTEIKMSTYKKNTIFDVKGSK